MRRIGEGVDLEMEDVNRICFDFERSFRQYEIAGKKYNVHLNDRNETVVELVKEKEASETLIPNLCGVTKNIG